MANQFSIKVDSEKINYGGFFFCRACLVAKPTNEQSPNPRYCQDCYDVMMMNSGSKQDSDVYWIGQYQQKGEKELSSFQYCIIAGFEWGVAPSGRIYCAGPVEKGKQQLVGTVPDATEKLPPITKEVGQKSRTRETPTPKDDKSKEGNFVPPQNGNEKQKVGRPHKVLPEDAIIKLSSDGFGSRQIAIKLSSEVGAKVSYKTIQRILAGQKALV